MHSGRRSPNERNGDNSRHAPNGGDDFGVGGGGELSNEMQMIHAMEARHAAQHGDLPLLRRLVDGGLVTVDAVDSDDCSLLHWAAINNRIEIAKLLIERKCNVNAVGGVLSSTPLHWASRHGLTQMVALLVRSGADWALKDVEGFTALHIAVQFGCTPVAAFFIAAGQSPDAADDTRMTPAMWAAYKVHSVFPLRMLAVMGADLELQDANYANTPLHWAVVQANHSAVNTLLRLDVNPEPVNKDKETPLDIARRKNDLLAIRLLELAVRERGMAPSTLRQRLYEDKKLARNALVTLPFFMTFCAAFIFDSSMDYLSKAELLTLLAIFSTITIRHFIRERRDFNVQNLLMGVSGATKLFMVVGWIVYLHPTVPFFMQICFLGLAVAVPYVFYRVSDSDPGFITITHKERCRMIVEMTGDANFNDNFCPTCLILKPHRSRHCRLCNKCVLQHDHHCPWLSNCVGALNHRLFVVYLVLLNLSTALVFAGCLYYWRENCGQISHENVMFCRPWVLMLHLLSFVFLIWTTMMSFIQGYELMAQFFNNGSSTSRRCRLNLGGNKLNMRSPFSRRCRLMRRICSLGCTPTFDADEDEAAYAAAMAGVTTTSGAGKSAATAKASEAKAGETSRLL